MSRKLLLLLLFISGTFLQRSFAQTDMDGLMMQKNFFCVGPTAGYSSFKNYWEGTLKRDNLNMGRVSATNFMIMGNYGITNRLNVLFGLPYIKTKASAGQMAGQKGLQDLSIWVKWVGYEKHIAKGDLQAIIIGGYSAPVSNYSPDILPLSIGLHSRAATIRLMADYQRGHWFGTASYSYVARNNVKLDRYTYYTTEMHYSNEVRMPDASQWNFRAGYRSEVLIAELVFNKWTTLGGFDIPRNGMPFVSNKMNATSIGINAKYETPLNGLSIVANGSTTLAGRNVGQSTGFNAGIFYIFDLSRKKKTDNKKDSQPKK
ncbi:MAG: hypothetical protein KTQ13_03145 [Ferruginibacter sp.]|nr:hypothetical protein [Ferruginibacter sp.]MBU9935622.1 hypothetical protein [Ferruginibacter sp.]